MNLRSETQTRVGMLEIQLQEKEENFTAKIQEMQHRLTEKEGLTSLIEQRTAEIMNLRSETQTRVGMLEVQLQEKEESLRAKESAIKQLEESLTAKIQEMEAQLNEKEAVLEISQTDLNDLRSKLDSLSNGPEGMVTLREEDVVILNLLANNGAKGMVPSKIQKEMTEALESISAEMKRFRTELQDRNLLLEARVKEVMMIEKSVQEKLGETKSIVQRLAGGETRKSHLVSFLATTRKRD
jgi:DNA repair exonuclease SbcCD ATPase subunit